jgi:hypothetical protein
MEDFFRPSRSLQGDQYDFTLDGYTEVQLAVSIEAFMNHPWDWSAFFAFATNDEGDMWKLMWITEDMMVWVEDENTRMDFEYLFQNGYQIGRAAFTAINGETHVLALAKNTQSFPLSAEVSSVFWHALTTSNCVNLRLKEWSNWCTGLCSGPALLRFLEASLSLELLEFEDFDFEEAQCHAFTTLERTGLEVTFEGCSFDAHGATGTFTEWLRHSQVVTNLKCAR